MEINKLKQKLLNGQTVYGPFCKLQDPTVVEIAALAGFDFVISLKPESARFRVPGVYDL